MLKEFWKKLSYYIFEDSEEITTKKPLCIYHGNCADGFAAAVIIRMYNPDMEFYPGIYGEQPPDVTDREVIMLDFSYKKDLLEMLAWRAKSILILDHHKSAEENLKDLLCLVQFLLYLYFSILNFYTLLLKYLYHKYILLVYH